MKNNIFEGSENTPTVWPPAPTQQKREDNQQQSQVLIQKRLLITGCISLSCSFLGLATIVLMMLVSNEIPSLYSDARFDLIKTISTTILTASLVTGLFSRRLWLGKIGIILSFLFLVVTLSYNKIY